MSKPIFNLVVESPGSATRHYQLSAQTITIGRGERNAIIIGEDAVSSRHGELRQRESGNGYDFVDLGSTNGTRLNGEVLGAEPRELHDGDLLVLGLTAKARFVRVIEIRDKVEAVTPAPGSMTKKLVRQAPSGPAINPVAAAVAKAARAKAKS
jgi:pSer/pThr/pTyr-binding forkhead associated (FHA) protein